MPLRKRKQTNATLYMLVVLIGLMLAAIAAAVVFYGEAEKYRTTNESQQRIFNDIANKSESDTIATIVGKKLPSKSMIGTMVAYLDEATTAILGGVAASTTAEVKAENANTGTKDALALAAQYINIGEPNTAGLVPAIKLLVAELENIKKARASTEKLLQDKESELASVVKTNAEKDKVLLEEKSKLQQQYDKVKQDYNNLQASLRQSTTEQVSTIMAQLNQLKQENKTLNDTLLKRQAELDLAQQSLQKAKAELVSIMPDPNATASKPDGKVIVIDAQAKTVQLDIGVNAHVYRGLRFTVYDRGAGVSPDGKGKAEIEVTDIAEHYSTARIISQGINRPILVGDTVANLIWDSSKTNVFVVKGDFDINGDGYIDDNAVERISELITNWGGKVEKDITINTDFVVLGNVPDVPVKPELRTQAADPSALSKYESALQKLEQYNTIKDQAQALWLPVFSYSRFLYFIGYQSPLSQAEALK
jgi:hypothetical protein